jgi:4-hydroxy-tetrahydrodipicolinate synthase
MKKKYAGIVVPMITPLTKNLKIDTKAVERIMAQFALSNISPLILGTTGESASVGYDESVVFIETAVKTKQPGQTIYAGLVGNNVTELIERAKKYAELGADVAVVTLPSYYILTPEQMKLFYTQLADSSPCPVMMYNIKATTQMSIPLDVIENLSVHPNIAGLKDSERDPERLKICIDTYKERSDFSFFCGWGAQGLNSLLMGADGIVPSTGNIVPQMYKNLYEAILVNDISLAEKFQKETDEVALLYQKDRTLGQSLAALKVMMETKNWCHPFMMPPLTRLSEDENDKIKQSMLINKHLFDE